MGIGDDTHACGDQVSQAPGVVALQLNVDEHAAQQVVQYFITTNLRFCIKFVAL